MNISERKDQLEKFVQARYRPIRRGGTTYVQTYTWAKLGIERVLVLLRAHPRQDQAARLMRDEIDFYLKRCHDYCIKERIGAHYREVGRRKGECDFEHVLPKALVRELLIYEEITVDEALNVPTCLLSKDNHRAINRIHVSTTPNIYDFWQRYRDNLRTLSIETHDGVAINMSTWNLADHYEYFKQFAKE